MSTSKYAQLTFQLGNPDAPYTVYTSADPADNKLTLRITTNTATSLPPASRCRCQARRRRPARLSTST